MFATLLNYWTYAVGISGAFYLLAALVSTRHTSPEAKATLSDFLQGRFDNGWASHFCSLFDRIFGEKALSAKRIARSIIASLTTVLLLYVLFGSVFGVLQRAEEDLPLWTVLAIGAGINVIPDYVSLIETRWLLRLFQKTHSFVAQLTILILDLLFSALIIWASISLFRLIIGEEYVSVVEMFAFFSIYSIFFYSTFLTSALAWLFFITTWFVRLFYRTPISRILDVNNRPEAQIGLVGAIIIFVVLASVEPIIVPSDDEKISRFDDFLCDTFPAEACYHVGRISEDVELFFAYLEKACDGGNYLHCVSTGMTLLGIDASRSESLLLKGCGEGETIGCSILGYEYYNGTRFTRDFEKAVFFTEKACEATWPISCVNLGTMYSSPYYQDEFNFELALKWFGEACDIGLPQGCRGIGEMYFNGRGVDSKYEEAAKWFGKACDRSYGEVCKITKSCGGDGCKSLADMYRRGMGVPQDDEQALYVL